MFIRSPKLINPSNDLTKVNKGTDKSEAKEDESDRQIAGHSDERASLFDTA